MPNFGVLDSNGKITTVIIADSKEDAETLMSTDCIEVPVGPGEPGPGWTWDGTSFIAPEIVE